MGASRDMAEGRTRPTSEHGSHPATFLSELRPANCIYAGAHDMKPTVIKTVPDGVSAVPNSIS